MSTPLKLFILGAGCCFVICCSTRRHRQSEIKQRSEARITNFRAMSVEQFDSLSVAQVHQTWQELEAVAIMPVGRFSYHRDSGFSGEAEKVVIYGRRNVAYDALQNQRHSHTRQEKRKLRDSTHIREAQRYEAKAVQRTGATSWRWWWIAIAVMVLIVLARVIRKYFRWRKLLGFLFPDKPG
ncbi:hypothetical protein [Sinomicrobium sp. M5D2P17]